MGWNCESHENSQLTSPLPPTWLKIQQPCRASIPNWDIVAIWLPYRRNQHRQHQQDHQTYFTLSISQFGTGLSFTTPLPSQLAFAPYPFAQSMNDLICRKNTDLNIIYTHNYMDCNSFASLPFATSQAGHSPFKTLPSKNSFQLHNRNGVHYEFGPRILPNLWPSVFSCQLTWAMALGTTRCLCMRVKRMVLRCPQGFLGKRVHLLVYS